jgi:hypothetical protein
MTLFEKESAGLFGVVTAAGTDAITGDFALVQCLTITTFGILTEPNRTGTVITGVALPAGTVLRGKFTACTLTSGTIRAHRSGPLSA